MNFSIEGIDDVVDKLTQYASGDKIQRGLAMAGEVVRAHAVANCPFARAISLFRIPQKAIGLITVAVGFLQHRVKLHSRSSYLH